jgi:subtilisin family serine protease
VPAGTYLYRTPARAAGVDADIQDAINEGIIIVASAGNSYWDMATSDLSDYNNSFIASIYTYYHSRGSSPGSADNVICVGSVGTTTLEYKSDFSNYGKRVDIWAPGSNITSSVYETFKKKSLEKNKGKRKAAADELGISERTLYRKIKQFDL